MEKKEEKTNSMTLDTWQGFWKDKTKSHGYEEIKKKKIDKKKQREDASFSKKKTSCKNLPPGWTREKVAKSYHKAGKKGGKGKFLELWSQKYDFKLSQQMAREWEKKFVLK